MAHTKVIVRKNERKQLFSDLLNEMESVLGLDGDQKLVKLLVPNKPKRSKSKSAKRKKDKSNPQQAKRSMLNNLRTGTSVEKRGVEHFIECAASAFVLGSYKIIAELEPIRVSEESLEKKSKEMDFFEKKDIRSDLETQRGIYIFYDSLGKAIYAGKTEKNYLWSEMKSAYNRARKTQQKFKRTNGVKIYKQSYYLHEVAAYASVYSVKPYAISFIEALLIHSFPNDLTNVRVEKNGKIKFESDSTKKSKKKKA